jgi:hypothetical protein
LLDPPQGPRVHFIDGSAGSGKTHSRRVRPLLRYSTGKRAPRYRSRACARSHAACSQSLSRIRRAHITPSNWPQTSR